MATSSNHGFYSPLRYPGGKGALANFIKITLDQNRLTDCDYVEIYAGGAGIAWALLFGEYVRDVHINDLDPSVMAFWRCVTADTDSLCRLIATTEVSMDEWHRQRAIQLAPEGRSTLELGFSTFFLNRTNRSGILRGGVIGGKGQTGTYKLNARFNKNDLIDRICRIALYADRIHLHERDGVEFLESAVPELRHQTLIYLDPPYYQKGQELYHNHYLPGDHARIAEVVCNQVQHPWVMSYDAAPEILSLYEGRDRILYGIQYSAQDRYEGAEVIFGSAGLELPRVENPCKVKLGHDGKLMANVIH